MKNQFFGDTRDLFKFDLIEHVMKSLDELKRFAFIPMLTPDEKPKSIKPGTKNKNLVAFFNEGKKRDIHDIQEYFKRRRITAEIHGEKGVYFKNDKESRRKYFDQINDDWLVDSLVFLDPDTGMKEKEPTAKHVLFSEIQQIYERMNENSIIMIYQHHSRKNREQDRQDRAKEIENKTGTAKPLVISDNDIMFLFLTKNAAIKTHLQQALKDYVRNYPNKVYTENVCH